MTFYPPPPNQNPHNPGQNYGPPNNGHPQQPQHPQGPQHHHHHHHWTPQPNHPHPHGPHQPHHPHGPPQPHHPHGPPQPNQPHYPRGPHQPHHPHGPHAPPQPHHPHGPHHPNHPHPHGPPQPNHPHGPHHPNRPHPHGPPQPRHDDRTAPSENVKYHIVHKQTGLCIQINHDTNRAPYELPRGSATTLSLRPIGMDQWDQEWDVHQGKISNLASGLVMHHGNQKVDIPFPCMCDPSNEQHQKWTFRGEAIVSQLDGKYLSVEGAYSGARVVMKNYGGSYVPQEASWILQPVQSKSRIQHMQSGLMLQVEHHGDPHNMRSGSHTKLTLQPPSNHFGQFWEFKNGKIRNVKTGFMLHHGNQNAKAPFACMCTPSNERHQDWEKRGDCFVSRLDGKGLTVNATTRGAQVVIRPFDTQNPPSDCRWKVVPA